MPGPTEGYRVGLDALETVTALLQRARSTDPTEGLFEAAEVQWWWRSPRTTDRMPQLFWFDHDGRPEAGVVATQWRGRSAKPDGVTSLLPIVLPHSPPSRIAHVIERGLEHAASHGIDRVELEVDRADDVSRDLLTGRGFTVCDDGVVVAWLDADDRPVVTPLPDGYRLLTRAETTDRPHHFIVQTDDHEEARLQQTSLYRPDLDLVVHDRDGDVAAYGLFWFDPVTATGVVEPMRTIDAHQGRGLARHVLTAGIDRLRAAGAGRISIGYEPGNPASGPLYRSVGFVPQQQTDLWAGPTGS